jgi:hypothetical protein
MNAHRRSNRVAPALSLFVLFGLLTGACTCGPQKITGGGGIPTPVVTPTQPGGHALNFGKVQLNRTRKVDFLLKNDGRSPLQINEVRAKSANFPNEFGIKLAGTITIEPGVTGKIPLAFTPIAAQDYTGEVALITNAQTQEFAVTLTGTGVDHTLEIDPTALDFGHVVVGSSLDKKLQIRNLAVYAEDLMVTDITGDGAPHYKKVPAVAPTELPAADASGAPGVVELTVTFTPKFSSGGQAFQAAFTVTPCAGCQTVPITLTGVAVDSGVDVSPNPMDFGFVNPNTTKKQVLTITNASAKQFDVKSILLDAQTTQDIAAFRLDAATVPPLPKTLGPGEKVEVTVTFTPSLVRQYGYDAKTASFTTHVKVKTSDSKAPEVDVGVKGFGGGPNIQVVPLELDFGATSTSAPLTKQLLITNTGYDDPTTTADDLQVTDMQVTVEGAVYTTTFSGTFTLKVGESQTVGLTFAPTAEQAYNDGELHIASNDGDTPDLLVKLTGTGVVLPPCDVRGAGVGADARPRLRGAQQGHQRLHGEQHPHRSGEPDGVLGGPAERPDHRGLPGRNRGLLHPQARTGAASAGGVRAGPVQHLRRQGGLLHLDAREHRSGGGPRGNEREGMPAHRAARSRLRGGGGELQLGDPRRAGLQHLLEHGDDQRDRPGAVDREGIQDHLEAALAGDPAGWDREGEHRLQRALPPHRRG